MQWGGLLSLKDTEINIPAMEKTSSVMEETNQSGAFASNVGIYGGIRLNCISRDFHSYGSVFDKILEKNKQI